jgi:hypothetical protein
VDGSRDVVIEEIEAMEKIELTQPQEGCQYQELILSIPLVEKIRQKASIFFKDYLMGMVHL